MFTIHRLIEKLTDWKRNQVLFFPVLLIISGLLASCLVITTRAESTFPAPVPTGITVTDQPVEASSQVYLSEDGQFSLQYPDTAIFYENQQVSVDGVLSPAENTLTIQDTSSDGSVLSLTYQSLPDNTSLADFIRTENDCMELSRLAGQSFSLQGYEAMLFPDTNCGPYGTTFIYTIVGNMGYRFTIETHENYSATAEFSDPILESFQTYAADVTIVSTPIP